MTQQYTLIETEKLARVREALEREQQIIPSKAFAEAIAILDQGKPVEVVGTGVMRPNGEWTGSGSNIEAMPEYLQVNPTDAAHGYFIGDLYAIKPSNHQTIKPPRELT